MSIRLFVATGAAICTVALPSTVIASPATVNLRVEGASETLFEGPVTTYPHDVKAANDTTLRECDGLNNGANATAAPTATNALNDGLLAADISWEANWDAPFQDYSVTQIGPDAQTPTQFWGLLVNWQFTPTSGCQFEVKPGDQILWAYNAFNATGFLDLSASATTVAPNQPIVVTVTDGTTATGTSGATVAPVNTDPTTGDETVETSDPSAVATNPSGQATLSWSTPGWKRIKAVKANTIRSNRLDICVTPCGPAPADTGVRQAGPTTTDSVPSTLQPNDVTVTLTATDPYSGIAGTYYTTGVDPPAPTTSSSIYNPASKPVLTNGEEIKYFSVNGGGVSEPVRTSNVALVSTTPPTTTDNVPSGWTSTPDTVTLTATDTGGSGVAATYYTAGINPPAPTTSSSIYNPANKPVLTDRQEIKYFSVDNVGNTETVRTSNVALVDTTPPTTTDNVPSGSTTTPDTVTLTATDTGGSGVAATYYTAGINPPAPTTSSSIYNPANKPVLSDGAEIKYFSVDNVGNTETVKTSNVANVAPSPPTITTPEPAGNGVPPTLTLSAAKHIQLDTTQSTFTIRCHLSAGPLTRCSVSLRHRDTTVATGTSTTSIVHLHLTRAGIELLVASLRDLSATITATAVPIAGSVSATTATTIVIHTQSITTPAQAFSQGATTLSLAGLRNVAALAHRIGQAKTILCNGDAANLGSRVVPSSQAISKARAAAVCDQLGRDGVHAVYIIAAKATRSPAASTRTPAGQAANRLVEVTITHAS